MEEWRDIEGYEGLYQVSNQNVVEIYLIILQQVVIIGHIYI